MGEQIEELYNGDITKGDQSIQVQSTAKLAPGSYFIGIRGKSTNYNKPLIIE